MPVDFKAALATAFEEYSAFQKACGLMRRLGFRPIVARDCVGDRIRGAVEWTLFDVDAKFGDVEGLDTVLDYLAILPSPGSA